MINTCHNISQDADQYKEYIAYIAYKKREEAATKYNDRNDNSCNNISEDEEQINYEQEYKELVIEVKKFLDVANNLEELSRLYSRDYRHLLGAIADLESAIDYECDSDYDSE